MDSDRDIKELIGIDDWGREYRVSKEDIKRRCSKIIKTIDSVIDDLKEKTDYENVDKLCSAIEMIEMIKEMV